MKKLNLISIFALTLLFVKTPVFAQETLNVVVAANLKSAMDSLIIIYQKENPTEKIQATYGSSGKLYEQIQHGAPFDVFFSADMNYPEKLKNLGFGVSKVKTYALGKIVIWSKKTDPNTQQMNSLLASNIKKISIANPAGAPYGAKAIESMKHYKVYDKIKNKLVYGENIAQTAQFVAFGAADMGIIALSDALSPKMKKEGGQFYIIPQESYAPIEQGCVVLKHGKSNPLAVKFYNFISSPKAIEILTYFGYAQKN